MSEIRATTISDAAGTGPIALTGQSAAKAWCRYNQGSNIVVSSVNVSSVIDNGTGLHTVYFSSLFTGDNACGTGSNDVFQCISEIEVTASSSFRWYIRRNDGVALDPVAGCSQYMGDLA